MVCDINKFPRPSNSQGWEFAHRILERIARFLPKKWANEQFAQKVSDSLIFWLETWAICSRSLIPSERPEQIACGRSFVLSNLSDSLTSLRRNEQIFCFLKNTVKNVQKIRLKIFFFEPIAYFLWAKDKSDRFAQKTDQFTHLSWVTWANRSHSLICHERHLSWAN